MPKRKSHFINSALSISRTFSCALDTFPGKTSCLFFPHLSNLAVRNEFRTELFFSTCSSWNYCHLIFSRSCFRPEVSLSIIVKCNVNRGAKWQGSEMEDHVQPIELVFVTMREWFHCNLRRYCTAPQMIPRASECIECSEKSLFLFEIFQIDSSNQTS